MSNDKTDNGGSGAGLSTSLSKALLCPCCGSSDTKLYHGGFGDFRNCQQCLCKWYPAKRTQRADELLEAVEYFVGLCDDIGNSWWCANCGRTDCAYDGTCTKCGTYIEDKQPDTEAIDAARETLNRHNDQADRPAKAGERIDS